MAVSVEVPNLGEGIAGGVVAEWYRADGAVVSTGELVCRVESSYAAFEVEAEGDGVLRHSKPPGSIESSGTVLGLIVPRGESVSSAAIAAPEDSQPNRRTTQPQKVEEHQALPREAAPVVVPFPRKFAAPPAETLEQAPGDAVAFDSSLFDPGDEPAEELAEPGGSIPGLPLWEPDDERPATAAHAADAPAPRFTPIAADAAAATRLSMAVHLDVGECGRMLTVCAKEWRGSSEAPILEDLLLRAIARAASEAGLPTANCGLVLAEPQSEASIALADPGGRALREAVAKRASGGNAAAGPTDWLLTSLVALGVHAATPRLAPGHTIGFAAGAASRDGLATLTMAYDGSRLSEGAAARLLVRVRDIVEAPYSMLV